MAGGGIKLNPKYKPILTTDKRYIIGTGGRGSGKSFNIESILEDLTFIKGHTILVSRYTMTSAEISIIPEFTEKIELAGDQAYFNVTKKNIINKATGSSILFRGIKTSSGNQTANLKSINGLTTFVVDEAEEFTSEIDFDKIDLSVRTKGAKNRVILVLNPASKEHWIYQRWFKNSYKIEYIDGFPVQISTHPDVLHIHTTYLDNIKNLSESFIRRVESLKVNNPKKYGHQIIGGWLDKAEGVVFEEWTEGDFVNTGYMCHGLDFGFFPDPLAMLKVSVDKRNKKIYAKEEIYKNKLSDDQLEDLMRVYVGRSEMIVSDVNEPRTFDALRRKGFNMRKAKKGKNSIAEDIRDIIGYTLIVDPDSHNLKTELNNYVWNDKKASIPIDDFNHLIDALRYAFRKLVGSSGISMDYK